MPIKNKSKSTLILALGISVSVIFGQINSAIAQTGNSGNEGYQSNERDALYGGSTFGDFNPMDAIHNLKFRNSRNSEEFSQDSQVQINNSASEFKRLQQQRVLESQSNNDSDKPETAATE